jgi:hypothetical protein
MLTFSLIITLLSMTVQERGIVDERLIEDTVPAELEKRRDVADLILRLSVLRRNQSIFGEKHPQFQKILVDIKSLEDQLSTILNAGKPPSPPIVGANKSETLPRKESPTTSESVTAKPVERKLALGLKERPVWKNLNIPLLKRETPYQLHPLPPSGYLDSFSQVGAFPALGMLWGLEVDIPRGRSRWIKWQQLSPNKTRAIQWTTTGLVKSIALDSDFENCGRVYVARFQPAAADSGANGVLEILLLVTEREPPFDCKSTEMPIAKFRVTSLDSFGLIAGDNGTVYVSGLQGGLEYVDNDCMANAITKGVYKIVSLPTDEERESPPVLNGQSESLEPVETSAEASSHNLFFEKERGILWRLDTPVDKVLATAIDKRKNTNDQLTNLEWASDSDLNLISPCVGSFLGTGVPGSTLVAINKKNGTVVGMSIEKPELGLRTLCQTSLSLRGLCLDSNGEPILRDELGQIYMLAKARPEASTEMPTKLSEVGIFLDMKEKTVSDAFVGYTTKTMSEENEKESADSRTDQWLGIPSGRVEFSESENAIYTNGSILVQNIHSGGNSKTTAISETRILVHQSREWYGFVYMWNTDQTDAILAGTNGSFEALSRQDCRVCHLQPNNQFILGFRPSNLTEYHHYKPNESALQIRTLRQIGILP